MPVPVPLPPDAIIDVKLNDSNDVVSDGEVSDEEDNDSVAMAKKRMKSSYRSSSMLGPEFHALSSIMSVIPPDGRFAGTWERQQTFNVQVMDVSARGKGEDLLSAMSVSHHIEFVSPVRVRIKEVLGSQVLIDEAYDVSADFIETKVCRVTLNVVFISQSLCSEDANVLHS